MLPGGSEEHPRDWNLNGEMASVDLRRLVRRWVGGLRDVRWMRLNGR